jgi:competence protein ComEC
VALVLALDALASRCATGRSIDRFAMWRDGAQAAWLGAGAVIRTDRGVRGDRPWVPPTPLPGRASDLPLATTDTGSR